MKTLLLPFATLIICCFFYFSCMKTSTQAGSGSSTDTALLVSPVGSPIGSPVSQSIDASGGTLISGDGILHVIIPPGALSSATTISIQAVQNTVAFAFYNGYSLTPNGQKFLIPITLEFHYRNEDLDTVDPGGLTAAYQAPDQTWTAFDTSLVDTTNYTVSVQTDHFTIYDLLPATRINPEQATVLIGKTITLSPQTHIDEDFGKRYGLVSGWRNDEAHPEGIWTVNNGPGNSTYGTISVSGASAIFKAPARVPSPSMVTVRFTRQLGKGKLILTSRIKIVGSKLYQLDIVDVENDRFVEGIDYYDSASILFKLTPSNNNANFNISQDSIHNTEPTASPQSVTVLNCEYDWVPDHVGTLNVTNGSGSLSAFGGDSSLLVLRFSTSGGSTPIFKVFCPGADETTSGGEPNNPILIYPFFITETDSVQLIGSLGQPHARLTIKSNQN